MRRKKIFILVFAIDRNNTDQVSWPTVISIGVYMCIYYFMPNSYYLQFYEFWINVITRNYFSKSIFLWTGSEYLAYFYTTTLAKADTLESIISFRFYSNAQTISHCLICYLF